MIAGAGFATPTSYAAGAGPEAGNARIFRLDPSSGPAGWNPLHISVQLAAERKPMQTLHQDKQSPEALCRI